MKKIFSIFLSFVFLTSAMGMTINSHFCGKNLTSISFSKKGCCCKKSNKMKKSCCKNAQVHVKITDDFSPASHFNIEKFDAIAIVLNSSSLIAVPSSAAYRLFSNHSPPPIFPDRVVAFHSFLI